MLVEVHPAPRHRYTFSEYLEIEEVARVRHEYFDGEIYAMAGGTPEHAAVCAAVTASLAGQLAGGPCRVYSSDLRVRLPTGLSTYPDVTVCGRSERDPESSTHVTNPKVVVEVASPSTAEYDRGEKLQHYQQVSTIEAIVLIEIDPARIDVWSREGSAWTSHSFAAGEVASVPGIACMLSVDEIVGAARDA